MEIVVQEKEGISTISFLGNSELTYSAVKEKDPDAIVFYFPDTVSYAVLAKESFPAGSVKNVEITKKNFDTKIKIFTTGDLPYVVKKEGLNLIVRVRDGVFASEADKHVKKDIPLEKKEVEKTAENFESIGFKKKTDFLEIKIKADGKIKEYNSFTLKNPPRIVFDFKNIFSPYKNEQKTEINTEWAKNLRHYYDKKRLRIVIDSRTKWLDKYHAVPSKEGLIISIGKETPLKTKQIQKEKLKVPSYVTGIDFSALENGRSKIIITTNKKTEYRAEKKDENRLAIKLMNTKIAGYHQRPIITTRFDSAVNRIFPVYDKKINKENSLLLIDLRENVPFKIDDETEGRIEIEFESSSREAEKGKELKSPKWEEILTDKSLEIDEKDSKVQQEKPVKQNLTQKAAEEKAGGLKLQPLSGKKEELQNDSVPEPVVSKEKKYSGQPITLDFYETDIKNVFRIIQHVSGLNFAIDKDVTGKVTMTLKQPVPWDQVLDLILKMNSLGMQKEGSIVRIAKHETLETEEERKKDMLKAKQESKEQEKNFAPLVTEYLLINYSDAEAEILPHIEKILSERGSISVDKRNNQIILTETSEQIEKAKQIIEKIDKITPQVVIEARIVEANTNFTKDIGTEWQMSTSTDDASKYASIYKDALGGSYGYNIAMSTPQETGSIGINFARITGTPFILNAKLNAMEVQKKGKIISAPKIVTLDNKKATIKQGYEYPYTTLEDGETKTEFKDVDLQLEVTPHVTADNKISLKVNIDKNDVYEQTDDGPALSTKNVQTELLVNDGDTIVIGGIIQKSETLTKRQFPWLSQIPVLGWLFKAKSDIKSKNELLIFLTPRIVELEQSKF